jgi:diacylglycerol kinase family enzyme
LEGYDSKRFSKDYDKRYIKFFQSSEIKFEFEEETPWTTDGEFGGLVKTVVIKIFRMQLLFSDNNTMYIFAVRHYAVPLLYSA